MFGLFYPNRIPAGTVSGGSWLAARPVTKVANDDLTDVARSTNALAASTKILVDLGASYALRAFALAYTNLSNAATWVLKVGTSSGAGDVLTTGSLAAWDLTTETALSALGLQDTSAYYLRRFHQIYVHSATVSGRYVSFEISDTGNAAGYVEVGKAFAAGGYVPTAGSVQQQDGWQDLSGLSRAESGALWVTSRRRMRQAALSVEWRTQAEADLLHDLLRYAGTTEDVLYVPDVSDVARMQRYGFVGTLRELSPLECPPGMLNAYSLQLAIDEIT